MKFVILRLGTIYGVSPGMRFHTAVNNLLSSGIQSTFDCLENRFKSEETLFRPK